jgi:hypothetical protein
LAGLPCGSPAFVIKDSSLAADNPAYHASFYPNNDYILFFAPSNNVFRLLRSSRGFSSHDYSLDTDYSIPNLVDFGGQA